MLVLLFFYGKSTKREEKLRHFQLFWGMTKGNWWIFGDIVEHLNDLNVKLQGESILLLI